MPLLRKKEFEKKKPPHDLSPDEEVFYCPITHEMFRDYDEFFERMILCNSLVWTCKFTNKTGLTYQEAEESEKKARKTIGSLPTELKIPVLYVASLTKRGRMNDVIDDVFYYVRDRYFWKEKVMAVIDNMWCRSEVTQVIAPAASELANCSVDTTIESVCTSGDGTREKVFWPPADLFKYDVCETESDDDVIKIYRLAAEDVRREKCLFTREKLKFFLKENMTFGNSRIWEVKESAWAQYCLDNKSMACFFAGPEPIFTETRAIARKSQTPVTSNSLPNKK